MEDSPTYRPDRQALFDLASEQSGYFTAGQAARCDYAPNVLAYHAKRDTFRRVHHGVYRFRDFPFSPREDVVAGWLAVGKDEAVISHESALDLWDLSDVVPDAVLVTVPRARRSLARRPLPGVIVHTTTRPWDNGEVRRNEGIHVTSPERTILDAAEAGTQPEQIEMAIEQALRRGWLDALHLRARAREREHRVSSLVEQALARYQIEAPA
jgi:predicted transcriptional regulator of viral defense system